MAESGQGPVLVLTAYFPPAARAGGPLRSLDELAHAGLDGRVHVIAGARDRGAAAPMPGIRVGTWTRYATAQVLYLDHAGSSAWRFYRELRRLRPTHVYLNSLFAVWTAVVPLLAWRAGLLGACRVVVAPRGQLDPGALGLHAGRKRLVLAVLRASGVLRRVRWHATSGLEVQHVRRAVGGRSARVVLARPAPLPVVTAAPQPVERPHRPLRLVFLGRLSPKKGLLALLQVLRAVQEPVLLEVYGPTDDVDYAQACVAAAGELPPHVQVQFRGAVAAEAVPAALGAADVFVLPTLGENFGHAVYEALSCGCPVLITDTTPWSDAVARGAGWLVRPGPDELAIAIERVLAAGPADFAARSQRARAEAEAYAESAEAEARAGWRRLFA